jgi:hypothetical protein
MIKWLGHSYLDHYFSALNTFLRYNVAQCPQRLHSKILNLETNNKLQRTFEELPANLTNRETPLSTILVYKNRIKIKLNDNKELLYVGYQYDELDFAAPQ